MIAVLALLKTAWTFVSGFGLQVGHAIETVIPESARNAIFKYAAAGFLGWVLCYAHYDVKSSRIEAALWREARDKTFSALSDRIKAADDALIAQRARDDHAYQELQDRNASTDAAYRRALAQLHQERENHAISSSDCVFSGDARRLLDHAAGADLGSDLTATAESAAVEANVPSGAAAAPLTCGQLYVGYLNLSAWARGIASDYIVLRNWTADTYPP